MWTEFSQLLFESRTQALRAASMSTRSYFSFDCCGNHRVLHSFPTRRSSDLEVVSPQIASRRAWSSALTTCAIAARRRSEEHTSELQSRLHLVCRLLLEKKNGLLHHRELARRDHLPGDVFQRHVQRHDVGGAD